MQGEHFLTEKSVSQLTTFSRATINRRVAAGEFPKPFWISKRRKVWKESDVSVWMTAQTSMLAERGAA